MGFDTYLKIDDRIALMWRKYASSLPRLLFRHDQLVIETHEAEESPRIGVSFQATADEVLQNLDDAGLGWQATVAAYSEIRLNGTTTGMVMGEGFIAKESDDQIQERVRAFKALPPEVDLSALGTVLAHQWTTLGDDDEMMILKDITYDGDIESTSDIGFEVFKAAKNIGAVNAFAAARAAESWVALYRDAPLLAWPILMCVFLRYLPQHTIVTLDLSEDASETARVTTEDEARDYATSYWTSSSEGLANVAQTFGRLFGVLASFDNKLGRHFWFERAAALHATILSLANVEDEISTKVRGDALESLVEALLRTEEPELKVLEKNFRTQQEEIDILLSNSLSDPFWLALGSPLIIIECKNWKTKPGVPELRILESKIIDRGAICRVGIFVSMSGFAQTALDRLRDFQSDGGIIFAVNGEDLESLITSKTRLTEWLRTEGVLRSLGR
jgi:Restriction endonuclease